jgi:hypothetical protein
VRQFGAGGRGSGIVAPFAPVPACPKKRFSPARTTPSTSSCAGSTSCWRWLITATCTTRALRCQGCVGHNSRQHGLCACGHQRLYATPKQKGISPCQTSLKPHKVRCAWTSCGGRSALLARAGLLRGRQAASPWTFMASVLRQDNSVKFVSHRPWIHDGPIWTCDSPVHATESAGSARRRATRRSQMEPSGLPSEGPRGNILTLESKNHENHQQRPGHHSTVGS